ncbi:hypothetical protein VTL71DRAFT_3562 [Oculimacula yallundae]|uniref:Uncharacterized protein n=1 Tax=Oculimacula yallundae TaxID=86028 RepID=A0ABR4C892_9HELO
MPAIHLSPLLVREVHGVLAKREVDHTVIEAVVVILVCRKSRQQIMATPISHHLQTKIPASDTTLLKEIP